MKPYFETESGKLYHGDALRVLKSLHDNSIQCVVTSPPYWGLRDYGIGGQIGLEETIEEYVSKLVAIFQEIKRVLRNDGTIWLNLGDTYNNATSGSRNPNRWPKQSRNDHAPDKKPISQLLKVKDLCGIPWRVAFALQDDGWYLRQDIIWHKPNPMPESVKDRPTKAHEYLFLISKSSRYYYNFEAIKEPASLKTHARYARGRSNHHKYADGGPRNQTIAKDFEHMRKPGVNPKALQVPAGWQTGPGSHNKIPKGRYKQNPQFANAVKDLVNFRSKRSVWTIPTQSFSDAHFATFPEKLIKPCILAGSKKGDIILDPFFGSGTVGVVAHQYSRQFIGIDLNQKYCEMAKKRIEQETQQLKLCV